MKKFTLILAMAAVLLAGILSGCGKAEAKVKTVNSGVLTVALSPDFAPMEFVDTSKTGQDQYVGFDVFLAKFLAEELELKL